MMSIEDWRKAGKIAGEVREWSRDFVKPGAKVVDVANKIEAKIRSMDGELAFPVNISFNQVAAHDTANFDDSRVLKDELVKVDVGVHVNGCIGDTALTVDLSGKYQKLIQSAEEALNDAIEQVRKEPKLGLIGKRIEDKILSFGFQPVRNLSGHGITVFEVHDEPSIPNYDTKSSKLIPKGTFFAIEPFATTGIGKITEKGEGIIFSIVADKNVRDLISRKVLAHIKTKYSTLPFSKRELFLSFKPFEAEFALKQLQQQGILHSYPPLVEVSDGFVSQAEHTLYLGDEVEVLTKY
jgi:methionyl aminopeptidase